MGWVARRRDLGNLLFLDVRDRTGIVQVVFNKETQPAAHAKAEQARSEFVVASGRQSPQASKANPGLASGEVELVASKLHILNTAKTPAVPNRRRNQRGGRDAPPFPLSRSAPAEATPQSRVAPQNHSRNPQGHGRDGLH